MTMKWGAKEREKVLTWSVLGAALASLPATYLHASTGSAHDIGVLLGWLVWAVFATEVMVMVGFSEDAGGWLRSHQFELIVTMTSFPLFLDLPGVREIIGVFPALGAVKLLKALKILKLVKVFKLLHSSSLAGWLVRMTSLAGALVALGLLGSMIAEQKLATPAHGISYLGDELSQVTNTGRTVGIALLVAGVVAIIEWWAWKQRKKALATC